MNNKIKNLGLFVFALALPLLIGYFGSLLTTPSINTWYVALMKPSFTPPNWIFSPVWTLLFVLMGVAFYLILKNGRGNKYYLGACLSFGAQLFLNIYWSFLFFYIKEPPLAFYAIVSLWSMIIVNIYYFYLIKKSAAYLLVPYILWVSFAAALNYAIWYLNIGSFH